jgi:hypothetical protein
MPKFITFCFLTAPPLVGVAFTLAWPSTAEFQGSRAVVLFGAGWVVAAYLSQKYLRGLKPLSWARWWILSALALPFAGLFAISLVDDPAFIDAFERHDRAVEQRGPGGLAPSAPSRHALSRAEVGEWFALVQQRAVRFAIQLLTCVPPLWWLAAFGLAAWRKK